MSLHDVDKTGGRRSASKLNQNDSLSQRMAVGTPSVNYTTQENASSNAQLFGGNARLIKTDTVQVVAPDGTAGVITTTTTTVAHGLGYAPIVTAYMNNILGGGYGIQLPMWVSFGANTDGVGGAPEYLGVIRYMTFASDTTNIYILTYSSGSAVATNYTITYYLWQQTQVY